MELHLSCTNPSIYELSHSTKYYVYNYLSTPWSLFSSNPWWRHQMETFSALLALCAGNSPVPVNSPHKCQWRGALMFSLICARINDWVNNREAGDLRRHRGHYGISVMHNKNSGRYHGSWQSMRFFRLCLTYPFWCCMNNGVCWRGPIWPFNTLCKRQHVYKCMQVVKNVTKTGCV